MGMLYSRPMPVADHFIAFCRADAYGKTAVADLGEVCETCYTHCAGGKTELWRHARDEHGADPNLSCHVPGCGRRFFAAAMCADHRAHHHIAGPSGRPPLTCELCGRLSVNRSAYYKHVNAAHPEARAAMCGVCHSYEGDVWSLIDHVRRRHVLELVTAETTAASNGSYPKRAHRRSIRCTVCGKRYGNNHNMNAHRRVHGLADDLVPVHPQ
ncbi:zinc finger protein 771-like [Rhopalosiphum padi]|uniref:zinc finger protein 771-like n=1 Tax=Rhopalosiphum padi TaxID=40932 RepID=UPI00298E3B6E|nr:zinc finger protein 771-like [Rhopalosiphum padi]